MLGFILWSSLAADSPRAAQMVDQFPRIVRLGVGTPGDMPVGSH
jgi:hypothetical protein